MRVDGARKGSAFVSEELAFQKAGGDCRAIHLHQISVPAGAELVNRASDDFLTGASFASNQNCSTCGSNCFDLSEDLTETPTPAHDCLHKRKFLALLPASA